MVQTRNAISSFNSPNWNIHNESTVLSDSHLELNASGSFRHNDEIVDLVEPNTQYTIHVGGGKAERQIRIQEQNSADSVLTTHYLNDDETLTFTTQGSTDKLEVRFWNRSSGTFDYIEPMLNLGDTALPYEPKVEGATEMTLDSLEPAPDPLPAGVLARMYLDGTLRVSDLQVDANINNAYLDMNGTLWVKSYTEVGDKVQIELDGGVTINNVIQG